MLSRDNRDLVGGASRDNGRARVLLGFEDRCRVLNIGSILPLKTLRAGVRESRKYSQIVSSIRTIGVIEAPVVVPDPAHAGRYLLLDGHLRLEALKDLGFADVECLIATEEDTYSYNKWVNRPPPIQEHRMVVRAVDRGVSPETIAEALGLDVQTIRKRFRLLDGICPEAADLLKDSACSMKIFEVLRRMSAMRQLEAAELMIGQGNFSVVFARALLAATSDDQLVDQRRVRNGPGPSPNSQQIARMERELAVLQTRVKSIEDTYGIDNLHLTVARGYLGRLLANPEIVRWLSQNRQEYLTEFLRIAEIGLGSAELAA